MDESFIVNVDTVGYVAGKLLGMLKNRTFKLTIVETYHDHNGLRTFVSQPYRSQLIPVYVAALGKFHAPVCCSLFQNCTLAAFVLHEAYATHSWVATDVVTVHFKEDSITIHVKYDIGWESTHIFSVL